MTKHISLQQTATVCCCNMDNCNETPYVAGVRPFDLQTDASNAAANPNSNAATAQIVPSNAISATTSPAQSGDSGHGRVTDDHRKQQQSAVTLRNASSRPHAFTVAVLAGVWLLSR
jgi:hypothetical protein